MGGAPDGYLQLTDAAGNRAGSILYNKPIPATAGVSLTFEQYQYGGNGADGIGFFLVDGSTSLTDTGGLGGSLGYAQRNGEPGVTGGYLGVGLDAYGNFYDDGENRGAGCPAGQRSPSTATGPIAPNVITLRGPGSGLSGLLLAGFDGAEADHQPDEAGHHSQRRHGNAARRHAGRFAAHDQRPGDTRHRRTTRLPASSFRSSTSTAGRGSTELDVPAPPNTPSTYKFGFSASTGGSNDVHLLRDAHDRHDQPAARAFSSRSRSTGTARRSRPSSPPAPSSRISTRSPTPGRPSRRSPSPTTRSRRRPSPATRRPSRPLRRPAPRTVCRGTYTVTAADVAAGEVVNIATANAVPGAGGTVVSPPATVTVPLVSSHHDRQGRDDARRPTRSGNRSSIRYTLTNTGGCAPARLPHHGRPHALVAITCPAASLDPRPSTIVRRARTSSRADQINAAGFLVNTASVTLDDRHRADRSQPACAGADPRRHRRRRHQDGRRDQHRSSARRHLHHHRDQQRAVAATGVVITDVVPDGDPVGQRRLPLIARRHWEPTTPPPARWAIPRLSARTDRDPHDHRDRQHRHAVHEQRHANPDRPARPRSDERSRVGDPQSRSPQRSTSLSPSPSIDSEIPLGGTATFTIDATNNGPFAASGVELRDVLPPGLASCETAGPRRTYDPATGVWTIGALAVGATATRTIAVTGTALGSPTSTSRRSRETPRRMTSTRRTTPTRPSVIVVRPPADLAVVKAVFPQTRRRRPRGHLPARSEQSRPRSRLAGDRRRCLP